MKDYAKLYMKRVAEEERQLNKLKLPKLAGFVESTKEEFFWYDGANRKMTHRILTNDLFKIKFIFKSGGIGTAEYWYEPQGKPGFWASFDRRGVDNSFYWIARSYSKGGKDRVKTHEELIEIFRELVERVKKQREFAKTAITVPQIGFSTSPDRKAKDVATLKQNGYISFRPSGFGTGYTITRSKQRFAERATKALEDFYGVGALYLMRVDCD